MNKSDTAPALPKLIFTWVGHKLIRVYLHSSGRKAQESCEPLDDIISKRDVSQEGNRHQAREGNRLGWSGRVFPLKLETSWRKRSQPWEECGTVFQAEGTEVEKRSAWLECGDGRAQRGGQGPMGRGSV